MGKISVLDCTLRDGGYCNGWAFGRQNIRKILSGLTDAGIDVIECGYLTGQAPPNPDSTLFPTLRQAAAFIPPNRGGRQFVCMVNYGEYPLDAIPDCDGSTMDGLRVTFHKQELVEALEFCQAIVKKGYKVFIQAMASLSYSDEEFLDLIRRVNAFSPYAFYIVDSFGVMKRRDLIRLFSMVEHNLKDGILIGYHSHNNMQLAYSNAQALADMRVQRDIIIDCSVFGMGRGAGNLNTELFVEYLNDHTGSAYQLKPLLAIIDEILNGFYQESYWGYSLPNYLSAKHNTHPNYAACLDAKKTLTVENMEEIFAMMADEKRASYDKHYIEDLYLRYMARGQAHETRLHELRTRIWGKDVLIIAPGKSSEEEKKKILAVARRENVVAISVNFDYPAFDTDFIFLSNLRRFRELDGRKHGKCIVTSNIPAVDVYLQADYRSLLNRWEAVRDNAGMMLIQFLIQLGARRILLAGLDGYSIDPEQNFADQKMSFYTQRAVLEAMNTGMTNALREFGQRISIQFVTTPRFVRPWKEAAHE